MRRQLFFLLALALTACSTAVPSTSTVTPGATRRLTPTILPTTALQPTSTPTQTSTPHPSFQWAADAPPVACLQVRPVRPTLPPRLNLPWVLLGDWGGKNFRLVDPDNGTISYVPFPSDKMFGPDLSPDGKWLAYEDFDPMTEGPYPFFVEPAQNLLTNSANGRFKAWQPKGNVGFRGWLSNSTLAFEANPNRSIVFNPFTKQEYDFAYLELPNAADHLVDMSGTFAFASANSLPDPTLTRLIYVAYDKDGHRYTPLWDIQNKKMFGGGFLMFSSPFNSPPGWSLDGSDFILLGVEPEEPYHHEWFQMTRDGKWRQLTHFQEYLSDLQVWEDSRSWDGRYLSIQIRFASNQNLKTLVMDLKSPTLDGFCIENGNQKELNFYGMSWSPDSKFLLLTEGNNGGNNWGHWTLVDLEKQAAYLIASDIYFDVTGWIAADGPLPTSVPTVTPP